VLLLTAVNADMCYFNTVSKGADYFRGCVCTFIVIVHVTEFHCRLCYILCQCMSMCCLSC